MSVKPFLIITIVMLFLGSVNAVELELVEENYLKNATIVANLKLVVGNYLNPDSEINVRIDNADVSRISLKDLMDLNQISYNVTESIFSISNSSSATKTINDDTLIGIRLPPGVVNLADVIVSGNNAEEPRIDIGNDGTDEWIYLGQRNSFRPAITGSGVSFGSASGNFILSTINTFLCSKINLPLTKDIKVEAKYKLSDAASTGGNITATLFSIDSDGISASGGSDTCDLPEPDTNLDFRSCTMHLSNVAEGEYYICISTNTDRTDGGDLYSIPIDNQQDSSFLCSGDVGSGMFGCARAQGGDFFIRAYAGQYGRTLNGNTNFTEWQTFPDSIRLMIQAQLTNCAENCQIPIKVKLADGTFNINRFLVRSGSFETDSIYSGSFTDSRFTKINNVNASGINLTLSLNWLSLNTTNLEYGLHRLSLRIGNVEIDKLFSVATTATSSRFNLTKNSIITANNELNELLSKNQEILVKLGKKTDVEGAISALRLKISELSNIENQTISASEKDQRANEILNITNKLIEKLPRSIIVKGSASDKQVIDLNDLKGFAKFNEKELFFEQKNIAGKIEIMVLELTDFSNNKELKTFVNAEATANDNLREGEYLLLIPINLRNKAKGIELNDEKGFKVKKAMSRGEKTSFSFNLDGNQLSSFYSFKIIYIPEWIQPNVMAECGNKVCEVPLENKITCPIDCERKFPFKIMIILIISGIAISLIVYLFTRENKWLTNSLFKKKDKLGPIKSYISNCLKKNIPENKIKAALSQKGWSKTEIDAAFKLVKK